MCIFYGSWLPAVTLRNSFERKLFVSGMVSLVFTSFASVDYNRMSYKVTASGAVQSTSHRVVAPLYLVMDGGFSHTRMTGSDETDRNPTCWYARQDACTPHLDMASEGPNYAKCYRKEGFNNSSMRTIAFSWEKVMIHKCWKPGNFTC